MPGRSITDLPWPIDQNRIDLLAPDFETEQLAAREDAIRAKSARKQAQKHGGEWGERANALAALIDPKVHSAVPATLASSRYLRDQRIRLFSDLHRLLRDTPPASFVRADVIKPSWARDVFGLQEINPNQLLGEFRADILRVAPANTENGFPTTLVPGRNDFLFAAIHGEFDQLAQVFCPHVHIGATGCYIEMVNRLRKLKGYRPTNLVRAPVRITRKIYDLPGALTYILKSYWAQRPFLPLGADGANKRPHKRQRIDEPYHTEVLLWHDQWKLADIVLLMGLRVGKEGFMLI